LGYESSSHNKSPQPTAYGSGWVQPLGLSGSQSN
jgi:hypothetical protein